MPIVRQIQPGEWQLGRAVRLAALQDAPAAFAETYANALTRPDDFWQDRAERGAAGETSFFAIALAADEPVGMAVGLIDPDDPKQAYLVAMWVAPQHRGTGMAAELVDSVANWATARAAAVLYAGVTQGNLRARAFYRKIGFADHTGVNPDHPATSGCQQVLSKRL
jgi:RimJ/RimL family protein N-acetyltransferase